MPYWEVEIVVEGALDEIKVCSSEWAADEFVKDVLDECTEKGLEMQAYEVFHDHDLTEEECACVQYLQDHRPVAETVPGSRE